MRGRKTGGRCTSYKLAPHKSDMQPSREKAREKGGHPHTHMQLHTREERGTERENEVECIEKRQGGRGVFQRTL